MTVFLASAEASLSTITLGQVAVFAANLLVLLGLVVKAAPLFRKLRDLAEDWAGEPARPGVPSRPGVMERLQGIETRTTQLEHNGGGSMRDDVTAMRDELGDHMRRSDAERAALWQALGGRRSLPPAPTEEEM